MVVITLRMRRQENPLFSTESTCKSVEGAAADLNADNETMVTQRIFQSFEQKEEVLNLSDHFVISQVLSFITCLGRGK